MKVVCNAHLTCLHRLYCNHANSHNIVEGEDRCFLDSNYGHNEDCTCNSIQAERKLKLERLNEKM